MPQSETIPHHRKALLFVENFWKRIDSSVIVLFPLPFLLLRLQGAWIYNYYAIDPWYYLGYFLRYEQYLKTFGNADYYSTRLAWLLPGHLLYSVLPPLIARHVLHLGFYYAALIGLYFTLKQLVGKRGALTASVMLGCNLYFLFAVGTDYTDGAGITYCILVLYFLTTAAIAKHWHVAVVLAGVFYGCSLHTNVAWLMAALPLLLYYLLLNRSHQRHPVLVSIGLMAAGVLAITICLGGINVMAGGKFFFFLPSVGTAVALSSAPSGMRIPWSQWWFRADWLLLASVVCSGNLLLLIGQRLRWWSLQVSAMVVAVSLLLFAGIMAVIDRTIAPVLQLLYYANYITPFVYLAIGHQAASVVERLKPYQFAIVAAFGSTILLVQSVTLSVDLQALLYSGIYLTSLVLFIFSRSSPLRVGLSLGVACTALFTVMQAGSLNTLVVGLSQPHQLAQQRLDNQGIQRAVFLTTTDVISYLKDVDPEVKTWFWYNDQESPAYSAITQTSLWHNRLMSNTFPELKIAHFKESQSAAQKRFSSYLAQSNPFQLAVLSRQPDAVDLAIKALDQIGYRAEKSSALEVKRKYISFKATILKVFPK